MKKEQKQKWTKRQEKAFGELKKRFTKELVLVVLNLDKKIRIEVNVSDYTIEKVLPMECKDRKWQLVAFLSKYLNEIKRNYEIHNKKILAVIRKLENQQYLLKDVKYKFEVQTNYKNLEYFIKAQNLNQRQAHWALYLSRFNFTLKYILGIKIEKTDELSRRLDQKIGVEKNNNNQIFIKNCWLCNLYKVVIERPKVDILEKIKKARSKDEEVVGVVKEMKKVGIKAVRGEKQQLKGDLVLKEEKVYMLKNKKLRVEIIQLYHNMLVAGHEGKWKMTELVTRNYQWLGIIKDMEKYVEEYDICQRIKNRTEVPTVKLKLSKVLEKP